MRIGAVAPPWIPVPPPLYGGIEAVAALRAAALARRGHDVTLVAAKGSHVEGVRVVKRHQRPVGDQPGGIVHKEAFIDVSNVAYWDAEAGKRIKVGFSVVDDKKVRVDRKTGSVLDKG